MGRSRGGLTSKIHVVVDSNGLPVRLALTAGEAHDNRLAFKLLSRLKSGTMLLATVAMTRTGSEPSPPRGAFAGAADVGGYGRRGDHHLVAQLADRPAGT
jgi:transposase